MKSSASTVKELIATVKDTFSKQETRRISKLCVPHGKCVNVNYYEYSSATAHTQEHERSDATIQT